MLPLWMVVASATTGLVVESLSADALCPDLAQTERAVSDRIGQLDVPLGKVWRASYTLVHSPSTGQPDVVRLELRDPEASVRLVRDLPLGGQSCRDMASVIALVLDRYFRSLREAEQPEPTQDRTASVPTQSSVQVRVDEQQRSSAPTAAARPHDRAVEPHTGAAPPPNGMRTVWLGAAAGWMSQPQGFGLEFAVHTQPTPFLHVGVSLQSVLTEARENVGPGEAHLTSQAARAWIAATAAEERWTAYAGPELGLSADHAWTTGLTANGGTWRPRLLFGLAAGAVAWMLPNLGMTLRAGLDLSPRHLATELVVADEPVIEQSVVQGYVSLGVAVGF